MQFNDRRGFRNGGGEKIFASQERRVVRTPRSPRRVVRPATLAEDRKENAVLTTVGGRWADFVRVATADRRPGTGRGRRLHSSQKMGFESNVRAAWGSAS